MSDMSVAKYQVAREAASRREVLDMRRVEENFNKQISKIQKHNESLSKTMEKDYQVKIENDKSKYNEKLRLIRTSQEKKLVEEEQRYNQALGDLKESQVAKMQQIKETQEREVQDQLERHATYMENAKRKFNEEKDKLNS
jgi:hypothetical protein